MLVALTAAASAVGFVALDQVGLIEISAATTPVPQGHPLPATIVVKSIPIIAEQDPAPLNQPAPAADANSAAQALKLASYTEEQPAAQAVPADEDTENNDNWSAEIRSEPAPHPALPTTSSAEPSKGAPLNVSPAAGLKSASLKERLAEISPGAHTRLASKFQSAQAAFPPAAIVLVGIKDEKALDLYARPAGGKWKFIYRYQVLASSGVSGPKLRQGDKQVPEGIYGISLLNPNSRYHVSMRVNYPNEFDRRMAQKDGRTDLGGDIMIHGKNVSIGCLAIGDEASEEVFTLASDVGLSNIKVIIAPTDFRKHGMPAADTTQPSWVPTLYTQVASAMQEFEAPPSQGLLSFFFN